jgi:hypothetical protein
MGMARTLAAIVDGTHMARKVGDSGNILTRMRMVCSDGIFE